MPESNPDATQQMQQPEAPPSASRLSVPPSEPRGSRASIADLDAAVDRPARLQMIVALFLGLVLVAIPLYLWRRPRADSITIARANADAGAGDLATITPPDAAVDDGKPSIGEPRVLACHDPGTKKTAPADCDHLAEVEKAFTKAIEDTASCVPKDSGGGTIQFVADVSFKRRSATVIAPRDGRTVKSSRVAGGCATAVRAKLAALSFETIPHAHARYKVSITATYPAGKP